MIAPPLNASKNKSYVIEGGRTNISELLARYYALLSAMSLENTLDDLHSAVTNRWYFQWFTAATRILLAVGFIPPSYKKIIHQPFTMLPDSHPVGHYFNALLQTGFYYEFIGWSQMIAAILLLFPRTAPFGGVLFLPIIANIAVLTNSVGFVGTWLLTILMTLAAVWLTAWEYDRFKPWLFVARSRPAQTGRLSMVTIPIIFGLCGVIASLVFWKIRLGNFADYLKVSEILIAMGVTFGIVVALHLRFMKVGELRYSRDE